MPEDDIFNQNLKEYREIIFNKYKSYADYAQYSAATSGKESYSNKSIADIVRDYDNTGAAHQGSVSDRELELKEYFKNKGLLSHEETITNANGVSETIEVDDTEKFLKKYIIDEDFVNGLNDYTSSDEYDEIYQSNKEKPPPENQEKPDPKPNNADETVKEPTQTVDEEVKNATKNSDEIVKETPNVTQRATNQAEKQAGKAGKGLKKAKISGKGAAALFVAGLIIGKVIDDDDDKKEKKDQPKYGQDMSKRMSMTYLGHEYSGPEQEVAANISSYRYGRHIN